MNIIVLGAAGFIGGHLAQRLKNEGHTVTGVDIKLPEYRDSKEICTYFVQADLRTYDIEKLLFDFGPVDEVYQLAADMGGAGYIFSGENDANVMHNSAMINLRVADACVKNGKVGRVFYSSSACAYPAYNQMDPDNPKCSEESVYPSAPDSEYGWEKIFSERLYKAFERNYGLEVRIARFHNVFGPYGTWKGGKEKAPAAICRKVAESKNPSYLYTINTTNEIGVIKKKYVQCDYIPKEDEQVMTWTHYDEIDIWGDGKQTRSFLYIDECVEGIIKLMRSDCKEVLNIGSDEMLSINDLAKMVIRISGKNLLINNIDGPTGVRGRNSDNTLIKQKLNWSPTAPLEDGITKLFHWINQQVNGNNG